MPVSLNPFLSAQKQLEKTAGFLKIQPEVLEILKYPQRVIELNIPVKMDNGTTKLFKGFRSQHNNFRGPYKGGIRYHPQVTKEEVIALSMWMTWKCAVAGIPFGGGKGGIVVAPKELSLNELKRLSRAYARALAPFIGVYIDVPAPDVNTDAQTMGWMIKAYASEAQKQKLKLSKGEILATFTGKPVKMGGSLGREEATGRGGVFVLEELNQELRTKKEKLKVAIQGFGNVGYWFAELAFRRGFKIVAISDSKGGIVANVPLNPGAVMEWKKKAGSVVGFPGTRTISNEELFELPVDILVPAALEDIITKKNAKKIKAKIIIEMANGPTTPEADEILAKKKVILIPDILANSGGVTVSYFEWEQNLKNQHWPVKKVNGQLKRNITRAFNEVWRVMKEKKIDGRTAAYILGLGKVSKAAEKIPYKD